MNGGGPLRADLVTGVTFACPDACSPCHSESRLQSASRRIDSNRRMQLLREVLRRGRGAAPGTPCLLVLIIATGR